MQEFSHALLCLMDKIKQTSPDPVYQADVLLRDQFIERVIDVDLHRELKRLVRQTPGLSMLEVQAAAIQREHEGRPSGFTRGRSYSVPSLCAMQCSRVSQNVSSLPVSSANSEVAELRAMLLKQ